MRGSHSCRSRAALHSLGLAVGLGLAACGDEATAPRPPDAVTSGGASGVAAAGAAGGANGGGAGTGASGGAEGGAEGGAGGAKLGGAGGASGDSAGSGASGGGGVAGSGQAGSSAAGSGGQPTACGTVPMTGECLDTSTLRLCQGEHQELDGALAARVVTIPCGDGFVCANDPRGPFCARRDSCDPGATVCGLGTPALFTCQPDGAAFTSAPCPAGQRCAFAAAEEEGTSACSPVPDTVDTLRGCVTFERRVLALTGLSSPVAKPAPGLLVAVYEPAGTVPLGVGTTDDRGCFTLPLSARPSSAAILHATTVAFDEGTAKPSVGVAHNGTANDLVETSDDYWHWSNQDTGCGGGLATPIVLDAAGPGKHVLGSVDHDTTTNPEPDFLVPEACGSAAIGIFTTMHAAIARVHRDHRGLAPLAGETARITEQMPALPVVAYWEPGTDVPCGTCSNGKNGGPYHVTPGGLDDVFDMAIWISGSTMNGQHWSTSVVSHEMGHWSMHSFSRAPGEGGTHYVAGATKPGLSYSEGWASAFGQWNESSPSQGVWNPVYLDYRGDATYYVDLSKLTWNGGTLTGPGLDAKLDAPLNEFVIASVLFRLAAPQGSLPDAQGLGFDALLRAAASARLVGSLGRGYFRIDLLDFLDAGRCSGALPEGAIGALTKSHLYPWDANPRCE